MAAKTKLTKEKGHHNHAREAKKDVYVQNDDDDDDDNHHHQKRKLRKKTKRTYIKYAQK